MDYSIGLSPHTLCSIFCIWCWIVITQFLFANLYQSNWRSSSNGLLINFACFVQTPSQAVQLLAQVDKHVSPFTLSPNKRSIILVMEIKAFIDNIDHWDTLLLGPNLLIPAQLVLLIHCQVHFKIVLPSLLFTWTRFYRDTSSLLQN